ncbi:heme exporter protein CcmD [Marinobacter mobilis]|uniref:Heme exporter protein D n=1 Tax=Marinobacter mobilis TaxID=488533 RepID=A0A1H2YXQ3_9GAMM|nr:heme exporter protein CcmD [Marinobacter mobilis]SDX09538.1 heme exporter protein D [Marinobacter mobilis]
MAFDSISAFIVMGGHGPYVWTCYAVFVLALLGLGVWSRRQRNTVLRTQKRQMDLEQNGRVTDKPAPASFTRIHPS